MEREREAQRGIDEKEGMEREREKHRGGEMKERDGEEKRGME